MRRASGKMNCDLSRRLIVQCIIVVLYVAFSGCVTNRQQEPLFRKVVLALGQEMAGVVLVSSIATHHRESLVYWPTNAIEVERAIAELNSRFGAQTNELLRMIIAAASWFSDLKLTALTNGDLAVSYCSPVSHSKLIKFQVTQSGQTISFSESP